jgi:hypothetical protein
MFDQERVLKLALTLLYNKFLEEFEPGHSYAHSGLRQMIQSSRQGFEYCIAKRGQFIPSEDLDIDDLLIAFEDFTRNAHTEYMMMAVGEPSATSLLSVAVERGTATSVGWPAAGIRQLRHRVTTGQQSRMVAVHNHPKGLLHELFHLLELGLPGASDQDRNVSFQWMLHSITTNAVIPEFYLVEEGHFRRILAPSWGYLASMLKSVFPN